MSTHVLPIPNNDPEALHVAVAAAVREPSAIGDWDADAGTLVYTFTPDLTSAETAALADVVATTRTHDVEWTYAEYVALKPKLAEIRTFRTRTAAEWSTLTAAQRDNALIQWCQDLTDVLRALLRD